MPIPGFPRISVDPAICGGRPTVTGTRMRVSDVLDALGSGAEKDALVADFPYLSIEDIEACLLYAADQIGHPVVLAAE
jgi:uncharacterized protein (DUF433 family)